MPDQKFASGAHVVLHVNGTPFAEVSGVMFNPSSPDEEIKGIDDPEPVELATTYTRVQGSIDIYFRIGGGGIEGMGVAAMPRDIPRERYVTLTLIERVTGQVIFEVRNARVGTQGWNWRSKALATASLAFRGLTWSSAVGR